MTKKMDNKGVLDANTMAVIRAMYSEGMKVEAIGVRGIRNGVIGIIQEIRASGDIYVLWSTGDTTSVEYGVESIKPYSDRKCVLRINNTNGGCNGWLCKECGWDYDTYKERIARIRRGDWSIKEIDKKKVLYLKVKKTVINDGVQTAK